MNADVLLRCVVECSKAHFLGSRQTQGTHRRKEELDKDVSARRDQIPKSFVGLCEGASAPVSLVSGSLVSFVC